MVPHENCHSPRAEAEGIYLSHLAALCQAGILFYLVSNTQVKALWTRHARLEPTCSDSASPSLSGRVHWVLAASWCRRGCWSSPSSYLTGCGPVSPQEAKENNPVEALRAWSGMSAGTHDGLTFHLSPCVAPAEPTTHRASAGVPGKHSRDSPAGDHR